MFDPSDLARTGNRYADQFAAAADRLGLQTEVMNSAKSTVLISGNGRRLGVRAAIVGCNGMVAARISSNKYLASSRLRNAGFRVPEFRLYCTHDYPDPTQMSRTLDAFAARRYPVVIKPVRGQGGVHVYAGIEDPAGLRQVVDTVWRASLGEILLERHIHGNHYRVKLLDGEVTDVIARYPGFVIGDGQSSIAELIEHKNRTRREENIPTITPTDRMRGLLARAGLTLESILPEDHRQQLCIESNQYLGGDTERLPLAVISERMAQYLFRAAKVTGLRWMAMDLIVEDIEDPLAHEKVFINETNSAPAPAEYRRGFTEVEYLHQATLVLRRYFSI